MASKKAVGDKSDFALSDYRCWKPSMAIAGRDFKSGPGKEGWVTKMPWAKFQRLWSEVVGMEYGVDLECTNPGGRREDSSQEREVSPAPPAKRWISISCHGAPYTTFQVVC